MNEEPRGIELLADPRLSRDAAFTDARRELALVPRACEIVDLRPISRAVAVAVVCEAINAGLARLRDGIDVESIVDSPLWTPRCRTEVPARLDR